MTFESKVEASREFAESIKDKRISLLEEANKRRQYEIDTLKDRLDRRDKDIKALKIEIIRLNNVLIKHSLWDDMKESIINHFESEVKE